MCRLTKVPGVPDEILDIMYDWQTADPRLLSIAKSFFFFGRDDVLFDLRFNGDVQAGTAYIECDVLEKTGDRGNMNILGSIYLDDHGWRFESIEERFR